MTKLVGLALGAVLAATLAGGAQAQSNSSYEYDVAGRLVAAADGSKLTRYSYDAAGNRTRMARCDVAEPLRKWEAEAGLSHLNGSAVAGGWQMTPADNGNMSYGPYVTDIAPGDYVGLWRMKSSQVAYGDSSVSVSIDVWDATTGSYLAARNVPRSAWTAAGEYQILSLPFQVPASAAGHQIELRVWYSPWATIVQDWAGLSAKTTGASYTGERGQCASVWEARNLPHAFGEAAGESWASNGQAGHVIFGPYTTALDAGRRTAFWQVMIDSSTTGSSALAELDVYDASTGVQIATRTITPASFSGVGAWRWFTLDYDQTAGHTTEVRVRYITPGRLIVNRVGVF